MSDLVKRLRMKDEYLPLGHDGWEAADRLEELEAKLEAALDEIDEVEVYAWELEQRLGKAVEVLRELIDHTHNCEKELTEELHNADFCGESLPLTSARTTLAELRGQDDE